jgi:glycosyltransferase involved in cell wall biosynthesis
MYLHSYLKQRNSSTSLHFAQNDESPKDPITKRQNHSITNLPYHPFTTSPHHPIYAQGFTAHAFIKAKKKGLVLPEIIVNFHGLEMFQKAPSFRVKLEHLLLSSAVKYSVRGADISVSLGGKLTGILKKIVAKRIVEQGIGIEDSWLIDKVENIEHTNLRFVFIGRYERRKGIEELNEVLKELDFELNTPFQFDFIGPITDDKKIPRLSLGMTISYHGAINDENKIKEILRESDILVSPSWSEGMPTVILEAMASACAIIATDVGAVAEQVDASNGWLIEAGNKKQLKETIVEAISLPKKRLLQKKQNSIKKIKDNFLWEDVIKKTITELSSKVEEPHNPVCAKDLNKGK